MLHQNLRFLIVVAEHDITSAHYQNSVAQSPSRIIGDVDDLSSSELGLESLASMAAPSGVQTPRADAILLVNSLVGRESQAVVIRIWDVSTGKYYASKEPHTHKIHERLRDEIRLLSQINHVRQSCTPLTNSTS